MKKLTLTLILFVSLLSVGTAQFEIENLFGGANIGYAKPLGDFSEFAKGGFTYNVQLGYKLNDNFSVGVEYLSAVTAAIDTTLETGLFGVNLYGLNGYYAKAWYKFLDGSFKPYGALGLGLSQFSEPDVTVGTDTVEGASRMGFGANAEIGFVIKNFNLSYAFVLGGKSATEPVFNDKVADLGIVYHKFSVGYLYNF